MGRITQGTLKAGQDVLVMAGPEGNSYKGRINQIHQFQGLDRVQVTEAGPSEIVLINTNTGRLLPDVEAMYADTKKSASLLGWRTELSLADSLRDAWRWQLALAKGQK